MEGCGAIFAIALYIMFFAFVVGVLLISIGVGHIIGVFPGIFNAFKNYFTSIDEEISNNSMRTLSFILLFLIAIAGVIGPLVYFIIFRIIL